MMRLARLMLLVSMLWCVGCDGDSASEPDVPGGNGDDAGAALDAAGSGADATTTTSDAPDGLGADVAMSADVSADVTPPIQDTASDVELDITPSLTDVTPDVVHDVGSVPDAGDDPCNGDCVDPFPACTIVNGVPACVPCTTDEHCPGGTCDAPSFSCVPVPPVACDEDCILAGCEADSLFDLFCEPEQGCCLDHSGACDDAAAYCRADSGSECLSLDETVGSAIAALLPGPVGNPDYVGGLCSCEPSLDCVFGSPSCEGPVCPEGSTCVGYDGLVHILGTTDIPAFEGGVCTAFDVMHVTGDAGRRPPQR